LKEECKPDLLEWKNDYENDIEEGVEGGNNDANNDDTTNYVESNSSSSESHEDDSPNAVEGRIREKPSWMIDYETGERLYDEDNLNVMMMLAEDD
jgi:hypothetical protein